MTHRPTHTSCEISTISRSFAHWNQPPPTTTSRSVPDSAPPHLAGVAEQLPHIRLTAIRREAGEYLRCRIEADRTVVAHHLVALRHRPAALCQRSQRGLERALLSGRLGRRQGDHGGRGKGDGHVGPLRSRRRACLRRRGVPAHPSAMELAGRLSAEPAAPALDLFRRRQVATAQ